MREGPRRGSGRSLFDGEYSGRLLDHIAFPLGGIGAGMVCLSGTGKLTQLSIRNRPDIFNEPATFAALHLRGKGTRVLEGPVPTWKLFFPWGRDQNGSSANGAPGRDYGLPRFERATFTSRFPFATVALELDDWPVDAQVTGWSPFVPRDPDSSSLPMAGLEYTFANTSDSAMELVFSFSSINFLSQESGGIEILDGGFALIDHGREDEAAFAAVLDMGNVAVNPALFRGGWFDPLSLLWKELERGGPFSASSPIGERPSPGASLGKAFRLEPGECRTIPLLLSWYCPSSTLVEGMGTADEDCDPGRYVPWYAGRFRSIGEVASSWRDNYSSLRSRTQKFSDCFFDTTLPPECIDAVAANLSILKSPTVLRQRDGRLWAWEGCCDTVGCCHGSCSHVWNYAQAMPHLFPSLERTLRDTEFGEAQQPSGHQSFRVPLPIRDAKQEMVAAADGQLGGILKLYRDWRICGDTEWLRRLWPKARDSIDYSINTWDPDRRGALFEPHHVTYDIEFWGADAMCTSIYAAALAAAVAMARELGERCDDLEALAAKARVFLETELFNGEYFYQQTQWEGLRTTDPGQIDSYANTDYDSPEALSLFEKEGPKYQYGTGCLSDGIIGAWFAAVAGMEEVIDERKVASHLLSVFRYNFRSSLKAHVNTQRSAYAAAHEAGLLLCSWPRDGEPSLPFVYSNEVWTGIEYQVASHLIMHREIEAGLQIVRSCRRRYDGRIRNPFDEYECGHWYARAMASYALLEAFSGIRYDAVTQVLRIAPRIEGDFRSFISTALGYGTAGVRAGRPFLEVVDGAIPVSRIEYLPA